MRYRKKPIEVDAIQWDGVHFGEVRQFVQYEDEQQRLVQTDITAINGVLSFYCMKSAAFVTLQPDGWIIAEPDGEGFYPCTGEQFAATYEPAPLPDGEYDSTAFGEGSST